MLVQFYNVSKVYPKGKALDDVSLKIDRGEFVFLMGPSGAGKSTIIKMMFREEEPTRGQIFIADRSLIRMKPSDVPRVRRGMGIVFQDFKLLERKTVYENVAFAMEVVGKPNRDIRARVPEVLKMVGLQGKRIPFLTSCPAVSSSGSVLPGLWPTNPFYLLPTNLPAIWISTLRWRFWICLSI